MALTARTAPVVSVLLGVAAVFAAVPLLGYSMAIAAPAGFLDWVGGTTSPVLAAFTWDLFAVSGPTVGLIVFLSALALRWIYRRPGGASVLLLGLGALLTLYLLVPLAFGGPIVRPLPWWTRAAEASILLASLAAYPLLRRKPTEQP